MNPRFMASRRSCATRAQQNQGFITINSATGVSGFVWETLNRSTFYGKPAQLCDAGISKIKVLAPLILPQKFPHFLISASFDQHFRRRIAAMMAGHDK